MVGIFMALVMVTEPDAFKGGSQEPEYSIVTARKNPGCHCFLCDGDGTISAVSRVFERKGEM